MFAVGPGEGKYGIQRLKKGESGYPGNWRACSHPSIEAAAKGGMLSFVMVCSAGTKPETGISLLRPGVTCVRSIGHVKPGVAAGCEEQIGAHAAVTCLLNEQVQRQGCQVVRNGIRLR